MSFSVRPYYGNARGYTDRSTVKYTTQDLPSTSNVSHPSSPSAPKCGGGPGCNCGSDDTILYGLGALALAGGLYWMTKR